MEINDKIIEKYKQYLIQEEKSKETIDKYIAEIKTFVLWNKKENITKEEIIQYKKELINKKLNPSTINSKLSALNGLFKYLEHPEYCVKFLKIQRKVFQTEEKELTKREYEKLVETAYKQNKEQLALILQTIGATGIRVSELKYITKEAVLNGRACIHLKGKERVILIPKTLKKKLITFIKNNHIENEVFITKNKTPLDRKQIWRQMKQLCKEAKVDERKVFPHNLRHLFAITFYKLNKDIAKLADVLGHSSINTTRIYLISTGKEHLSFLEKLQLVC